jgi:hypothetical protein
VAVNGEAAVLVQQSSIERAWKASGNDEFWLLVRTKCGSLEEFAAAVFEPNEDAAARGEDGDAYAEAPSTSVHGFVVLLSRASSKGALHRWVTDFANRLQARGLGGKLAAAPEAPWPPWMASTLPPVPTTFIAWSVDIPAMTADSERRAHWHVPPSATDRIAQLADQWARLPGAELVLRQNIHRVAVRLDNASAPLARSVTETGMSGLQFLVDADEYTIHVALAFGGEGVFQLIGGRDTWQQRIARLRDALTALPADMNHGYIRPSVRAPNTSMDIDSAVQLPGIREYHVRYNKHLLDRCVPDAHGVQVLQTAHLERAHDLSAWDVTELGVGRHLVQARDLTPWYAETLPDADVLAQARADFAGALLTLDVIAANPPPWT